MSSIEIVIGVDILLKVQSLTYQTENSNGMHNRCQSATEQFDFIFIKLVFSVVITHR